MVFTNTKNLDVGALFTAIIGITIFLSSLVKLLPVVNIALINMSQISNFEFASFFEAGGVILLALSGAVVIAVIGLFKLTSSKR